MKLIECVPNFSEGRDQEVIKEIAQAITLEAKLLNVESDYDHNRTVITFAGNTKQVLKAAYKGIEKAAELINMSKHKGAHPRIGATDIVPFVPLEGATIKDCVKLANKLGKKVGKIGIPVYLYSEAAKKEERKSQSNIRKGEYEGLEAKMKLKEWKPDYGPKDFNPKSGATIIGARKVLIAYNVNLAKPDLDAAHIIAYTIRTSGILGSKGYFNKLQAKGMMLEKDNLAQVSMNLLDYETTGLAEVYQKIGDLAHRFHNEILESELIGLAPKKAFIHAGKYYNPNIENEEELIKTAVKKLKFGKDFDYKKKIIEYLV